MPHRRLPRIHDAGPQITAAPILSTTLWECQSLVPVKVIIDIFTTALGEAFALKVSKYGYFITHSARMNSLFMIGTR